MLFHMLQLLRSVVEPLLVVAAPDQDLPELPAEVNLVRDRSLGRGPLEGLYCGLNYLAGHIDAAYVTGCDTPLLRPDFIRFMLDQLGSHDVAVPVDGTRYHPLAAVYRTSVAPTIATLLAHDQLQMNSLYSAVATHAIDIQQLRSVDPELLSLVNLNSPEDYRRALQLAGYAPDTD